MSRLLCFAKRNTKEILRDPISAFFGVAFPIVLLLLLTLIDRSIPAQAQMTLFHIENLCPGIGVFSLSFLALFTAILISKDRGSSFLQRLFTSPLKSSDFILGYLLPLLPMALAQLFVCYATSLLLGLDFSVRILLACAVSLPIAVVNIALGMIFGTLLNEKAVGGVCGALLTNVSAWLSGIWFSLDLVGGAFKKFAYFLPYANAVDAARFALSGDYSSLWGSLWPVCLWAAALLFLAVFLFSRSRRAK